jgi:hypothetical protein
MEENKNQQSESSSEKLSKRFDEERTQWKRTVSDMSERMRDIYTVSDLLTDLYSQRQIALEYSHTLMSHLIRLNKLLRSKKAEKWLHYTQNYDLRLDKDPKNLLIDVDLGPLIEQKEMVENHLNYMRETVKSIDTMCFGVKYRISLEEFRRG